MLSLVACIAFSSSKSAPAAPRYEVIQKIAIGGEGGWDCLAIDSGSHRLFISRGTHVMVLDVRSGKLVGDILNTNGVHAIGFASKLNKGYITVGRDNTVLVFDLTTLKEIKRVAVGSRPDVAYFDAASNRFFAFNAGSNDATVIDVNSDTVVGTVKFEGKPEFCEGDGRGTLYVNIEDKSEIQKFDSKTLKILGSWPLAPAEEPSGLGFDHKHNILFSTCSNNLMAVSDAKTGKVIATPKIGGGPDGGGFDPGTGLAFSSNGQDGTLTVIGKNSSGMYDVLQTVQTQTSARTMAIDTKTHLIYLIAAEFQAPTDPASRRRTMVPGTAMILVVGPAQR